MESTAAASTAAHSVAPTPPGASAEDGPHDARLIEQTKRQIRELVQEITRLAESECSLDEFYEGFLSRVISALAAAGGAVWTADEAAGLTLQFEANLPRDEIAADERSSTQHALLLKKAAAEREPALVQPRSGSPDEDEPGNPTSMLVLLCPVLVDKKVHALVEVFQRPGAGPTTQRGYLRFLMQMCDLAADFVRNRQLRQYTDRHLLWERLEGFLDDVHRSLDVRRTAYTLANEGRRLIQCDRLTVVVRRGSYRVAAVSGVENIEHRAMETSLLARLAKLTAAAGEPLWYTGDQADVPPQLEEALQEYADRTHSRAVGVIPLHAPAEEDGDEERGSVVGAIIAEQINNAEIGDPLRQRTEVVARHGAAALSNAIAHSSVPLLPVFRAAGRVAALARPANLSRTILALGLVVAVIAALLLVPADFTLEGRGELQPLTRQDIFAPIDGMVIEVRAEHGKSLNQGDVVARMLNTEVGMRLTELRGQLLSREKRRASIQRRLLGGERLTRDEESRLNGELLEVVEEITSLKKQIHLQEQQRRHLDVESPLTGQVATLHVRKRLDRRTLKQGQVMMTVYNPGGGWELILHMPESRMGHIAAAQQASKRGLPVSFMLATHPGETFTGRVKEIHTTANQTAGQPGTVPILVSLEESKLPELRPGTTVTAKVHCGQRALGYVWFHDVIDFVKGKVLF